MEYGKKKLRHRAGVKSAQLLALGDVRYQADDTAIENIRFHYLNLASSCLLTLLHACRNKPVPYF